jgi:hypothetical protein
VKPEMKIEGMKELRGAIRRLGKLPQSAVTQATRKGAMVVLRAARDAAPADTGALRKGIVLKGEKRGKKGKKVYQVTFDAKMNEQFVKTSREGKRAYYPASQEYGFKTRQMADGTQYHASGKYYLRDAAVNAKPEMERVIVKALTDKVHKEWKKKHG